MSEQERIARLIYDTLTEDVRHKRLGFCVTDSAFDTTNPNGCPAIELNTDIGLVLLTMSLTLNE